MGWTHTVCTKRWVHCVSCNYYWWNGIKSNWKAFWSGSKCNSILNSGYILRRDWISQMMTMWQCYSNVSTIVIVVTVVRVRAAGVFVNFAVCSQLLAQRKSANGFEFKLEYVLMVDMICVVFKWLWSHIEFRTGRCRRPLLLHLIYIENCIPKTAHAVCKMNDNILIHRLCWSAVCSGVRLPMPAYVTDENYNAIIIIVVVVVSIEKKIQKPMRNARTFQFQKRPT